MNPIVKIEHNELVMIVSISTKLSKLLRLAAYSSGLSPSESLEEELDEEEEEDLRESSTSTGFCPSEEKAGG